MFKRFDAVRILTTRNISMLHGPAGRPSDPNAIWTVVAGIGSNKLMLAANETIIVINTDDVVKLADFNLQAAIENVKKIKNLADFERLYEKKGARNEQERKEG